MATDSFAARAGDTRTEIPVRRITDEDLKISLRQGLDDFLAMRGDLLFVGLLYPLLGILAALFTSGGALPFFLPIVAGVGLLGPVAAVGFYELARRRVAEGRHGGDKGEGGSGAGRSLRRRTYQARHSEGAHRCGRLQRCRTHPGGRQSIAVPGHHARSRQREGASRVGRGRSCRRCGSGAAQL